MTVEQRLLAVDFALNNCHLRVGGVARGGLSEEEEFAVGVSDEDGLHPSAHLRCGEVRLGCLQSSDVLVEEEGCFNVGVDGVGAGASDVEELFSEDNVVVEGVAEAVSRNGDVLVLAVGVVDEESIEPWLSGVIGSGREHGTHHEHLSESTRHLDRGG